MGEGLERRRGEPGDRDPPHRGRRPDPADRRRRRRAEPLEIVCGAHNFAVGDRVPLAPVGAILPGRLRDRPPQDARRRLQRDAVLGPGARPLRRRRRPAGPGRRVAGRARDARSWRRSGLRPDTVFDITVEGNRPDAWCIAGIARDLAARLGLPFAAARAARAAAERPAGRGGGDRVGGGARPLPPPHGVGAATDVAVGPSPRWIAQRLLLAGMRPINNVVDASNYVMLELGQPTHPYDLARLPGRGLIVRRARPGETVETLDGVQRTAGDAGPEPRRHRRGLPHLRRGGRRRWASAASWVAPRRRSPRPRPRSCSRRPTSRPWPSPAPPSASACARRPRRASSGAATPGGSSRRCGASASCWPRAFPGSRWRDGMLDVRGEVPEPFVVAVPVARVHRQIGVDARTASEIARLIEPIGFTVLERARGDDRSADGRRCRPTGPTCGPSPTGSTTSSRRSRGRSGTPTCRATSRRGPSRDGLTSLQRSRRAVKDVLAGLGASEGWTDTFVSDGGARRRRPAGPGGAGGQPPRRREAVPPALAHARPARGAGLQRQPPPARRSACSRSASSSRTPTRARPGSSSAAARAAPRRPCCPASASCCRPSSPATTTTPAPRWRRGT